MSTELSHNGEKIFEFLTNDLQTVNQLAKKSDMNWHVASRELAILTVLDKVDLVIFKKEKKDQYLYKLKDDEVNIV